jgi:hypothetical protein
VVPLAPALWVEIVRGYPPQFAPSQITGTFEALFKAALKTLPKD